MIDIKQIDPFSLPSIAIEDRDSMPNVCAVYFAISGDDTVLYVGKTITLRARWISHNILDLLAAFNDVKVTWLSLGALPKSNALKSEINKRLENIEEAYIDFFKPPLNRIRLCAGVPKSTVEQVEEIMQVTGMSKHEIFIKAFDDLYHQVVK